MKSWIRQISLVSLFSLISVMGVSPVEAHPSGMAQLWAAGDLTGARVWLHIRDVIRELEAGIDR